MRIALLLVAALSLVAVFVHSLLQPVIDTSPFVYVILAWCWIPLIVFGSFWAHELGHAVAGRIWGLRPIVVACVPLLARRDRTHWKIRPAKVMNVTAFAPSDLPPERFAVARRRAALGGPAVNLILGLVFLSALLALLVAASVSGKTPFESYASWPTVLASLAIWNGVIGWGTLSATFSPSPLEDGQIRSLLLAPDASRATGGAEVIRGFDRLNALKYGVRRPRDWSEDDVAFLRNVFREPDRSALHVELRLSCGLFLAITLADGHDYVAALRTLDDVAKTWHGTTVADFNSYQHARALTALIWSLQPGGAQTAEAILNSLSCASPIRASSLVKMTRSMIAFVNGDMTRARAELKPALIVLRRSSKFMAVAKTELDIAEGIAGELERYDRSYRVAA